MVIACLRQRINPGNSSIPLGKAPMKKSEKNPFSVCCKAFSLTSALLDQNSIFVRFYLQPRKRELADWMDVANDGDIVG